MNPDIYALLPPDKQAEYKKLFPEPIIDSVIYIDPKISPGFIRIQDAHTCTNNFDEHISLEELRQIHEDLNRDVIERDVGDGVIYIYDGFHLVGIKIV